jgi:hypothetical protein
MLTAGPHHWGTHLTPHGDLFLSGAQLHSHRFDPIALTWNQNVARTTHNATRRYGSSVLLGLRPPLYTARMLIAGGGATVATDSTEIIDLGVSTPQWEPTGSLTFKRVEHNAVLLPNGKILAIGGSKTNNKVDDNGEGSLLRDVRSRDRRLDCHGPTGVLASLPFNGLATTGWTSSIPW